MKNNNNKARLHFFCLLVVLSALSCTKVGKGFISPTMQYAVKILTIPKGQIVKSNAIVPDGSDIPLSVKWVHIYDSTGKVVDDIFSKQYPTIVWSQAYNAKTDTTFELITAKRTQVNMTPIVVDPTSGIIESTNTSLNVPNGNYSVDIEISNPAGTQLLKKAIVLNFYDGPTIMIDDPSIGSFSVSRLIANTGTGAPNNSLYYNGANNPFVVKTIQRISSDGNLLIVKMTDRNGVPFNPRTGEIKRRPGSGVNPNPPYLENLQLYAPDTYVATDTAMVIKFPITPFPIAPKSTNGYNLYYAVQGSAATMDSTTTWSASQTGPGKYYQGKSDPHYLGTVRDGLYDCSVRFPFKIIVPGSYLVTLKILSLTHR
ncbi:MAG: hypothetical protein J7539_17365 [Niabella sp.]|nr:hypothetical protein [Niabella sp.]